MLVLGICLADDLECMELKNQSNLKGSDKSESFFSSWRQKNSCRIGYVFCILRGILWGGSYKEVSVVAVCDWVIDLEKCQAANPDGFVFVFTQQQNNTGAFTGTCIKQPYSLNQKETLAIMQDSLTAFKQALIRKRIYGTANIDEIPDDDWSVDLTKNEARQCRGFVMVFTRDLENPNLWDGELTEWPWEETLEQSKIAVMLTEGSEAFLEAEPTAEAVRMKVGNLEILNSRERITQSFSGTK